MSFSPEHLSEENILDFSECKKPKNRQYTNWFDIRGIHDTKVIEAAGKCFDLDNMILEDIVNTHTRPAIEDMDDYLFFTFKLLGVDKNEESIHVEQLSLVLGKHWLVSFHENNTSLFEFFRERIRQAKGIIRERKEEYLFYRMIDIAVDNYFLVSEFISERLDEMEEKILEDPSQVSNEEIYRIKKVVAEERKMILPVREAISHMIRMDTHLLSEDTKRYLRDVYEHVIQILENIERQREMVNDFLNLYMSGLSNKMNEVMKVLTIFASIFIPLTFIAGIYGMNFNHMPELNWKYGYFITWGIMIGVAIALLIYFKRKNWI